MLIKNDFFTIYFGDSKDSINKQLDCVPQSIPLKEHTKFGRLIKTYNLADLALLNQTHSNYGMMVEQQIPAFNVEGDYLITTQKNVGLGVLTADCVPLIIYDEKNNALAAIHAGWRGAVLNIVPKTIEQMKSVWNSNVSHVRAFIGPSAKACCYQVQEDVIRQIDPTFVNEVIIRKDQNIYFDTAQLVALQLQKVGVAPAFINTECNRCTMCDHRYFSHRRQGLNAGRQITMAYLHK